MQIKIEGRLGSGHKVVRHRHAGFPQESHQDFAVFIEGYELVFKFLERAGDDEAQNVTLFIPEKVFERVVVLAETGVYQPDYCCEITFIEGGYRLLLHGLVLLLAGKGADTAVQGMTAEVQVAETDPVSIAGDGRADEYFSYRKSHLSGMEYQKILPEGAITEDIGCLSVLLEDKADSVVRTDLDQVDHGGVDVFCVYFSPVSMFGHIAHGQCQPLQKKGLDTLNAVNLCQLHCPAGILNDLNRFHP